MQSKSLCFITSDRFTLALINLTSPEKFFPYVIDKALLPSGMAGSRLELSLIKCPLEPKLTIRNKFQKYD